MKIAVLTYAHAQNPLAFPAQYPAETRELEDDAQIISPWVEMTQEELDALIEQYREQVQAIAAAKESVPSEVALWQFRAALKLSNLYAQVQDAIAQLPESQRIVIEEQIEYGNAIHRDHPTIKLMAASIGVSQSQVNDVFRLAASLT